jgi:hypothetical protein
MRTFNKDQTLNLDLDLDLNNLSSRKLWELLNSDTNLSLREKKNLTITLRTRRHYERELDTLQSSQAALH